MKRALIIGAPVAALIACVVVAARSSTASIPSVVVHRQTVVRHVTAERDLKTNSPMTKIRE